jgi:hypothetical protein
MIRQAAILVVCALMVLVAVWFSGGPGPERLPDVAAGVSVDERCSLVSYGSPSTVDGSLKWFVDNTGEPRIDCGQNSADETYRFVWTHSFESYHPVSVTIVRMGGDVTVVVNEYQITSPTSFMRTATSRRAIPFPEWTRVRTVIANSGFWQMDRDAPVAGFDGAMWTVEGRISQRYHRVSRWEPVHAGPMSFARICLELLKLGGRDDPRSRPFVGGHEQ